MKMHYRKVAVNTIYQIGNRIISAGLALLVSILMVNSSGLRAFGDYSIAVSFIAIFMALSEFGSTTTILHKFSNEAYLKEHFSTYLLYRLVIAFVSYILFGLVLVLYGYSEQVAKLVILGSPLVILNAINKAFFLIFQAKKNFKFQFISSVISLGFVTLAYSIFFQFVTITAEIGILVLLITGVINSIVLMYKYREYLSFSNIKGFGYMKDLYFDSWIIGVTLLVNLLMVNIDRQIMAKLLTSEDVGNYSLAYKLFEIVLIIPTFVMNIYYPILMAFFEDKKEYFQRFTKIVIQLGVFGLVVSGILYILAPLIIYVWKAENLSGTVLTLRILSLGSLFFFISSPLSWLLATLKNRILLLWCYVSGLIFNILCNIIFIPMYGYIASAYITILTEIIIIFGMVLALLQMRHKMTKY